MSTGDTQVKGTYEYHDIKVIITITQDIFLPSVFVCLSFCPLT